MRALADTDAFPATDLGVLRGLAALGATAGATALGHADRSTAVAASERWRPWRAYAVMQPVVRGGTAGSVREPRPRSLPDRPFPDSASRRRSAARTPGSRVPASRRSDVRHLLGMRPPTSAAVTPSSRDAPHSPTSAQSLDHGAHADDRVVAEPGPRCGRRSRGPASPTRPMVQARRGARARRSVLTAAAVAEDDLP